MSELKAVCITDYDYRTDKTYKNAIEQAKKGETANWVICCDGYYPFCSGCGEEPPGLEMSRYCPNCGRRMVTPERRKEKGQ